MKKVSSIHQITETSLTRLSACVDMGNMHVAARLQIVSCDNCM